jgi:hypothetical protein
VKRKIGSLNEYKFRRYPCSFIKEANSSDEESIAQKSKRQRQGEFGQQIQDQKKRFLEEVVFGSVIPKVEIFI